MPRFSVCFINLYSVDAINFQTDSINNLNDQFTSITGRSWTFFVLKEIYDRENGTYVYAPYKETISNNNSMVN